LFVCLKHRFKEYFTMERKSGLVLANSTHDQKVVGSNLVLSKLLDGNGVKYMQVIYSGLL